MRVLKIALQGIWTTFMFLPYARQDKSNISSSLKKKGYKYGKSSFRSKIVHEWVKRFESDRRLFVDGMIS